MTPLPLCGISPGRGENTHQFRCFSHPLGGVPEEPAPQSGGEGVIKKG